VDRSRSSYRGIAVAAFLVLIGLAIYFISKAYTHFNTGASKKDIYHADASYFEKARPYIKWMEDDDEIEGDINKYLRLDIETAYYRAIRSLNLSHSLDQDVALKEHFTKSVIRKIGHSLDTNHQVDFQKVNLTHHLKLHFLSLDKTVVSFTDVQSRTRKKISQTYTDDLESYKVNMILQDGRWRIDALEKAEPLKFLPNFLNPKDVGELGGMRGINYYPVAHPWKSFWNEYDEKVIVDDLQLIRELDFISVRIFIPFEIFGGALIERSMLEKLDHFIKEASENQLFVIPTLFDFPLGYDLEKYPMYDRHLESLLTRYDEEEALLFWDLKNEPDLDFAHAGERETMEWLSFVIERAKTYTSKPLTVGWSDLKYASLFSEELDVLSFHFYKDPAILSSGIQELRRSTSKPVMVSEYGKSTYQGIWQGGGSEKEQAEYINEISYLLDTENVGGVIWCLYDYENIPSDVFGWKPWLKAKQRNFGILKVDKTKKVLLQ